MSRWSFVLSPYHDLSPGRERAGTNPRVHGGRLTPGLVEVDSGAGVCWAYAHPGAGDLDRSGAKFGEPCRAGPLP